MVISAKTQRIRLIFSIFGWNLSKFADEIVKIWMRLFARGNTLLFRYFALHVKLRSGDIAV